MLHNEMKYMLLQFPRTVQFILWSGRNSISEIRANSKTSTFFYCFSPMYMDIVFTQQHSNINRSSGSSIFKRKKQKKTTTKQADNFSLSAQMHLIMRCKRKAFFTGLKLFPKNTHD